ncbi:hypothetical protein D3C80_1809130 [compost metagenome]
MKTSNFWNYTGEHAVSIAGYPPNFYKGRQYKKLAPKYWFFKKYKEDGDIDFYIEHYYKEVLDKLDAREVYEELGENAVLLCWENVFKGEFCHRRIVAEWFERELGIIVPELVVFEEPVLF